jgi:hypothetical protein
MAKEARETAGISEDTQTGAPKAKRVVNRGARGPQPVYVFVKQDPSTGKLVITKSFRDPRKMAGYFQTAQEEGSQFLVTTPE